ncbi:MAG: SIMPL domain-containing protein [Lachnospiraceae bacterium]|nr:SIMPL domain-containing protein [Lachnospiraceae bacterium]
MQRTITVKGIGSGSASPDYVTLSMILESKNQNYDKAMDLAEKHIKELTEALNCVGFAKETLKTTNFNVHTEYDNEKDHHGNWKKVFIGYIVTHNLKLEFDFDMERLSQALNAISGCEAYPQLSVAFTIKDPSGLKEEMLRCACANAKEKAEILCSASGAKLGTLLNIDYNWSEINVISRTGYRREENALHSVGTPMKARSIDIQPEDINVRDTATFTWEII